MPSSYEIVYRLGIPPEEGRYPGRAHTVRREHGLIVERDVPVEMRDGVKLLVDVFRPADQRELPVLLTYSPYGKHARKNADMFKRTDRDAEGTIDPGMDNVTLSHYTVWEGPDPLFWCAEGFAVINADARGSWGSEGTLTFCSPTEGIDGYDLVEWAARQSWSNGRVGMAGVSYLAWSQWNVAATQPPHLCAINPQNGFSDMYREFDHHGGMRETKFMPWWIESTAYSRTRVEDTTEMSKRHPLIDQYWRDRAPDLGKIIAPLYAIIDWGDQGIHARGTIEGFKQASSQHKWLEVHGRLKWPYVYGPESIKRQLQFFNAFLKEGHEALNWPKVNVEVREAYLVGSVRGESAWPLPGTEHTPLYLDAQTRRLASSPPEVEAETSYNSQDVSDDVKFDFTFEMDTELTGNMALRLWVESPEADDMDVFVAIDKLDTKGERVGFIFFSMFNNGPAALGWLRASHRELDVNRSTPAQPWHLHEREIPLPHGRPTALDIEIWPSSTLFRAGETLRLIVKGSDIAAYPDAPVSLEHAETKNVGMHVIHTGGAWNSHLLVPVIRRVEGDGNLSTK